MARSYRIAVVGGDGVGVEVVPEALKVLRAVCAQAGIRLDCTALPWGAGHYKRHGRFMPEDGLDQLRRFDAILFGAVGLGDVDDTLPAREYTFRIRVGFQQYVNYRPVRSFEGVPSPLAAAPNIDFVIIRENTEGEFVQQGAVENPDTPDGRATETSVFTRKGITRVARYSFGLARRRRRKLTNVTKSNTLIHGLAYWDSVIEQVARDYGDVQYGKMYVDNASANFVLHPEQFDVVLTTNMIGDILSDLGGALMGSLGLGASGNVNPEREYPSMFEPIHGSAPDIAGQGIANPIGAIWSAALMLEHLGEAAAGARVVAAVEQTLREGVLPPDLGGTARTSDVGDAIVARLGKPERWNHGPHC
jgi:tartrate dehydrogenase/decarboxylase/D-malate dehydrogenase